MRVSVFGIDTGALVEWFPIFQRKIVLSLEGSRGSEK
jgi:hypothetical protein